MSGKADTAGISPSYLPYLHFFLTPP
jgi:hypothetical protein